MKKQKGISTRHNPSVRIKNTTAGITLIALVITIIVLLILAGVSISMVIGNNGILNQASQAGVDTRNASEKEQVELAYLAAKTNKMANNDFTAVTKTEFVTAIEANGIYKESIDFTVDDSTAGKLVVKFNGSKIDYTIENEIVTPNYNGSENPDELIPEQITIPEGLALGDTVDYYANGSYKWEAQYASSDLATDGSADYYLKTGNGYTGGNYYDVGITTWRVYSIDESTGKIEIVPESFDFSHKVRLQGAQGYNNGVKLLNDACSALYSDSSKGITARSVNFEDFINYYDEDTFIEYYKSKPGNVDHVYQVGNIYDENFQLLSAFSGSSGVTTYPVIYEQEELSTITYSGSTTETKIEKGAGLARSEQPELISRTYNGATDGVISTSSSIRPYSTRKRIQAGEISNLAAGGNILIRTIRLLDCY